MSPKLALRLKVVGGVVRRDDAVVLIVCLQPNFSFLSVNDANEDDSGAGADDADDSGAHNDDVDVDDDINSATNDGSVDGRTSNQGDGHDGQRDDCNDAAYHDHQHHDENVDGSEK